MISLDGHNEMVTCCSYAKSGDLLATGSHAAKVIIINSSTSTCMQT